MNVGSEWLVDAAGCRAELLRDARALRQACAQLIASLDLHVVGEGHWHQFPPPGGVTGLFLLTESHLTLHTYPECGSASFNLYCCRPRRPWPWEAWLREQLGAARVTVRRIPRGAESPQTSEREEGVP
jgi:S-adenosylmethionine decarboxylase